MQFVTRKATASALTAVAMLAVAACERPTEPTVRRLTPGGPSLATTVETYNTYTPPVVDGVALLDRVCDVFIGEPIVEAGAAAPTKYDHQTLVVLPAGVTTIKIVGTTEMQASGSKLFTCDAFDRDPDGSLVDDPNDTDPSDGITELEQPVIDPATAHAAKGDAFQVNTSGVTVDLNGYSITVNPAFGTPGYEEFENLGITLVGDDVTLTNSTKETSRVFGFGHNIDIESVRPKVLGMRWDGDGDASTTDWVYNIETQGGFGIRGAAGPALIDQVKSVNPNLVDGQGFEARRLASGILTVTNSHFEGGAEGVFLREVSGVTFKDNYVGSAGGPGIATREATSRSGRPIEITGNTVAARANGITWGRDSRSPGNNLVLEKNKITVTSGSCLVSVSRRNTTFGPYTLTTLGQANGMTGAACRLDD